MNEVLLIEDRGRVRILTLNRPEKRNALDTALTQALLDALRAAAADAVGVVVLTGAGKAFCAGADLAEFKDLERKDLAEKRAELTMQLHRVFSEIGVPVLTAINGPAMGGGAGLALAGDLALAAESAQIGYPEIRHGILPAIVLANLTRQVGRKAAFELVATGAPMSARRARELGAVNHVVADDRLMEVTLALAETLASWKPESLQALKSLFYKAADLPLAEALEEGRKANIAMRARFERKA